MNLTAILRSITTSTSRYEERADGVIVQRVLATRTQTLAEARENTDAFLRLAGARPRAVLIDIRIVRAMQISARDHYADHDLGRQCSAVAFLVATPSSRQISQHWITGHTGPLPLAQFTDEAEALRWLHRVTGERPLLASNSSL